MLEVDVRHRLGGFALDARFRCGPGLTALFGPSGSGKTTIVNMIAGLIRPDAGRIAVDGRVLFDGARRLFVPAHRRRMGYVFQEGRLFPHLTVRQNLLYGRWFTPPAERRGKVERVVAMLGIGHLMDRRPRLLSGGEKQRVAIGRALLASPQLLLMDEPLAALDAPRKGEILPYIERLRDEAGIPIVYVSHAIDEVIRLATTVVLLDGGRVEAVGPAAEVMGRLDLFPASGRYEASALLDARVAARDPASGLTLLGTRAGDFRVPLLDLPEGAPLRLRIRARDVLLALAPPQGISALNVLPGQVAEVGPGEGPVVQVRLDLNGEVLLARVTRHSAGLLGLAPGGAIHAVIKSVAIDSPGRGRLAVEPGDDAEIDA